MYDAGDGGFDKENVRRASMSKKKKILSTGSFHGKGKTRSADRRTARPDATRLAVGSAAASPKDDSVARQDGDGEKGRRRGGSVGHSSS